MRTSRKSGRWLLLAAALAMPVGARASARKPKTALLRREAIRFDAAAITMRSLDHPRIIRTFAYAPPLREKIEKKLETGGYRYRDRVKNRYRPGTGVALAIRGKPSKRVREPRKRE